MEVSFPARVVAVCLVVGGLGACADGGALTAPVCGDGARAPGELCDGAALGGARCADYGYPAGALSCNETCDGHLVGGCEGVPDFRDRGVDPCAACGAGEVCRGLECVAAGPADLAVGALTVPPRRPVRVELDARGLPARLRAGALVVKGVALGREVRSALELSEVDEVGLALEADVYHLWWLPEDSAAQPWRSAPVAVTATTTVVSARIELFSVRVAAPHPDATPGRLRWRRLDAPALEGRAAWAEAPWTEDASAPHEVWLAAGRHAVTYQGSLRAPGWGLAAASPSRVAADVEVSGPTRVDLEVERDEVALTVAPEGGAGALPDALRRQVALTSLEYPGMSPVPLALTPEGTQRLRLAPGRYQLWLGPRPGPTFEASAGARRWTLDVDRVEGRLRGRPVAEAVRSVHVTSLRSEDPWTLEVSEGDRLLGFAPDEPMQVELRLADGLVWSLPPVEGRAELAEVEWPEVVRFEGRLTVDGGPEGGAGRAVWLAHVDDSGLRADVTRTQPDGTFALRAPRGTYALWTDGYRLHPRLELPAPGPRAFDAKTVPLEVSAPDFEGASASLFAYFGPGPTAAPALVEAPILLTREGLGPPPWSVRAWPGRYRLTLRAPEHRPKASLLDGERAFVLEAPARVELDGAPVDRVVRVQSAPPEADLVFEAALWTRRLPLERGTARGAVRGGAQQIWLEEPDGARVKLLDSR